MNAVSIEPGFESITEHWRPRIAASFNGQDIKLAKFQGEFVWHQHDETDEVFLVWKGRFRIEFRDRVVSLMPGDICVVPRGVEHRPVADEEVEVLLIEAVETRNTGNVVEGDAAGEVTLAGVMQMDQRLPAFVPPHWVTYFTVASADEVAGQTVSLGGKVLAEPFDSPFGRMAWIEDPFGAQFVALA